jgi:hypothetical protein
MLSTVQGLHPDMIVMTGDFIHAGDRYLPLAQEILSQLPKSALKFAVLGNHDLKDGSQGAAISAVLSKLNICVLRNEAVKITVNHISLWVAGVEDLLLGCPDLGRALSQIETASPDQSSASQSSVAQSPVLLLSHNPLLFDPAQEFSCFSVMFSGHTHAGHAYYHLLRWVYRHLLELKYLYGWYQVNQRFLYVTSGLGSAALYILKRKLGILLPRFRVQTIPEIPCFDCYFTKG